MSATYSLEPEMRRRLLLLFTSTAFILTAVLLRWLRPDQPGISETFALIGAVMIALPILYDTVTSIRSTGFAATQFYMDQYVLLALAACLGTGRYVTGGIVAIILVFGQMIEERTVIGVEFALAKLRKLTRVRAKKVTEEGEVEIDSSELVAGDKVRIRPGDSIPADGIVTGGDALIDQSSITGESGSGRCFRRLTNLRGDDEPQTASSKRKSPVPGKKPSSAASRESSRRRKIPKHPSCG